jgi:hypothetical protein
MSANSRDVDFVGNKTARLNLSRNKDHLYCTYQELVAITGEGFPTMKENLPTGAALEKGGVTSLIGDYSFDNSQERDVLGIRFMGLKRSIGDTVKSLQALERNAE